MWPHSRRRTTWHWIRRSRSKLFLQTASDDNRLATCHHCPLLIYQDLRYNDVEQYASCSTAFRTVHAMGTLRAHGEWHDEFHTAGGLPISCCCQAGLHRQRLVLLLHAVDRRGIRSDLHSTDQLLSELVLDTENAPFTQLLHNWEPCTRSHLLTARQHWVWTSWHLRMATQARSLPSRAAQPAFHQLKHVNGHTVSNADRDSLLRNYTISTIHTDCLFTALYIYLLLKLRTVRLS